MSLARLHPCRVCRCQPGFAVSPGSPARFEAACRLHLALATWREAFRDVLGYLFFEGEIDNRAQDLSVKVRRGRGEKSGYRVCFTNSVCGNFPLQRGLHKNVSVTPGLQIPG